jgi:adenylate cyclase
VKTLSRQIFRLFSLYAISVLLVALFSLQAIGKLSIPLLQQLENNVYDLRLKMTLPNSFDPRIVIVDIDEKSLLKEGRWLWPRNKLAYLVDVLFDYYRIKLLGFDMVFSEPDNSSGLPLLEHLATGSLKHDGLLISELEKVRSSLEYDRLFADSIRNKPVILGFGPRRDSMASSGALPRPVLTTEQFSIDPAVLFSATSYTGNLPVLQDAALASGSFSNPNMDDDGVLRRIPLLIRYRDGIYESLSLVMFRALLGFPPLEPQFETGYRSADGGRKLEALRIEGFRIPVDEDATVLVPYKGKQGSFRYVSATDVLNAEADPAIFENAIVIVGTTAVGLMDMRSTPVQNVYPGVEINANLLAGMLDQTFKERPVYTSTVEFLQIIGIGALMVFLLPRLSAGWGTALIVGCAGLLMAGNVYAWRAENISLNLAAPEILLFLLYANQMFFGFFLESQAKKRLANLFGQYVPTELVDEMSHQDSDFGIGGETREMTVLFSDVRGFTTISEGLSPDQLSQLMNEFLTPLTRVIHQHKGTIDKYMGDAIMAFWGAPLHDPQHGLHAVQAALEMIRTVEHIREEFKARGWPEIKLGVGLNTGFMNVGNMGSQFRMAYTVLGDAVNLGSRLEGLTKYYGVSIIVSETTRQTAPDYVFQELDRVRVKGKNKPITIFEPLGHHGEVGPARLAELGMYERALALYHRQQWQEAEHMFKLTVEQYSERVVYALYLERIAHFKEHPPGDEWDGAYTHTSK